MLHISYNFLEEQSTAMSKEFVSDTVLRLLKSAHSRPKIREDAATCLGFLAIGDGKYFAAKNLKSFIALIKLVNFINMKCCKMF